MDIKSEINEIMKDKSLPEDAKSNRYSDLLQDYQLLMAMKDACCGEEAVT